LRTASWMRRYVRSSDRAMVVGNVFLVVVSWTWIVCRARQADWAAATHPTEHHLAGHALPRVLLLHKFLFCSNIFRDVGFASKGRSLTIIIGEMVSNDSGHTLLWLPPQLSLMGMSLDTSSR
jgi:hypothetical protein